KGHIAETQTDLAGRTVRTIANYDNGTVTETDTDRDVTTDYQYDVYGRLATLTVRNAKGSGNGIADQATRYVYGSIDNASWVTAVVSPDSTDSIAQDPDTFVWSIASGTDHTSTSYDWLGRKTSDTDQRGVKHDYQYDSAGRLSADIVNNLGASSEH